MQRINNNPILLAPRDILRSIVSFETTLVLYLFASLYKGDPRFAWIPIDPTAMFFAHDPPLHSSTRFEVA